MPRAASPHSIDTQIARRVQRSPVMATNKKKNALPGGLSHAELVELFETQDMGELWDQMPEADFDIEIRRRKHLVALDDDLAGKVTKIARSRHVSSESLVNALLREKLAESV